MDSSWHLVMWRGAVASAMRGARGQAFLTEMLKAMDGLAEPKLIAEELEVDGAVCAIGAVGKARGISMEGLDPEDSAHVAATFGISEALAREIVYTNDSYHNETSTQRFDRMRKWIKDEIWNARGCVEDPYGIRDLRMSRRVHWGAVIEWNEL
jgi:hypothetical protein